MQQIRYFLALAQSLNFTRAAEECHVSQPALTRAIQALEAELGGDLIRRERQQSHLTELGRRMLPLMHKCYEAAQSAQSLAKAVKSSEVAPLALGVSHSINIAIMMPSMTELFRAYPGIQLKIRRGNGLEIGELLKAGSVDLAIAGPLGDDWVRLDRWRLFDEPVELVVNRQHPLASRNDVEVLQLRGERVMARIGCEMADELAGRLRALGIEMADTHEVETDQDLLALVETNAGVGFMPASSPDSNEVRRLQPRDFDLRRTVFVYGVAGRQRSPVASALLSLLRSNEWSLTGRP